MISGLSTSSAAVSTAKVPERRAKAEACEKRVRLVRNVDGLTQSIDLPLRDMERGRQPDVPLQANDIIYVPFSLGKNISLGLANITASASTALIYATR